MLFICFFSWSSGTQQFSTSVTDATQILHGLARPNLHCSKVSNRPQTKLDFATSEVIVLWRLSCGSENNHKSCLRWPDPQNLPDFTSSLFQKNCQYTQPRSKNLTMKDRLNERLSHFARPQDTWKLKQYYKPSPLSLLLFSEPFSPRCC